jgi:hypothetical protein
MTGMKESPQYYGLTGLLQRNCISILHSNWFMEEKSVVPTEFITPRLYIAHVTHMTDDESVVEWVVRVVGIGRSLIFGRFSSNSGEGSTKILA